MPHRFSLAALLLGPACVYSHHPVQPSALGVPSSSKQLLAVLDQPGPLQVETIASADWQVTRAGLIDLHDPKARAAHLDDGDEPIQIFFHVIRHPQKGVFLIDTGVERALRDAPDRAAIRGLVAKVMHLEKMTFHEPLGDFLAREPRPIAGVFFTHLHLDHVSGLADVPHGTPLYAGPGETTGHSWMNLFLRPNIERALAGQAALSEWPFRPDPDGRFAGVVDVFGDGTLWAIWTPGHTAGSTAYLARTPQGPVLFTGDTCHTAWGWENDVPPGTFTADARENVASLAALEKLVAEHAEIDVRLGHQRLPKLAQAQPRP
jgi:N-acyl homoserine lactone hydrolase